ncbi:hypothetical protein K7957_13735 [Sphingomonas yunnanensis]|uniref:hypothetical protein n=1 Tax=Sphingomonas yunnanensis TaxID=310400 RepID=UPI001CA6EAC8|nr:hypothetical protein [Sphingomonas yunnanensis]MBY9064001.1 hypothetical protein [Sphingomonas yunnanensis]
MVVPCLAALVIAAAQLPAPVPGVAAPPSEPAGAARADTDPVPVPAAEQRLGDNGDIIVAAPTRKVIGNRVRAATGPVSQNVPIARFQAPVCVAVGGLPGRVSGEIAQRMLEDADVAGISLAGERCRPNTMVLFVDDAHAEVARMAKSNHRALLGVGFRARRALLKSAGPAFAWRLTEVRTRDGETSLPGDGPPTFHVASASRIVQPVRQDVVTAVLIVERKAVVGKTSRQLADYAALRLFAGARELPGGGLESMLTLFGSSAEPPAQLTAFDRGYLRGLYTGAANAFAFSQRGRMAGAIARENEAGAPATP